MTELEINKLRNSTVSYLYAIRDEIDMSPSYQRQGAVWSLSKQQLLIDSLLNEFDIPKLYFHLFPTPRVGSNGKKMRYALVDGRQRLEAIFRFMENKFALDKDFVYLADESLNIGGLTFKEIMELHPGMLSRLQSTTLDVVSIRTDDLELIEELFSRLNEAVPLNAAEKRNAFGGPCPPAVRTLVMNDFFTSRLPFSNQRYRHLDLAAKFLYWEESLSQRRIVEPVRDAKKFRLDTFFKEMKEERDGAAQVLGFTDSCLQRQTSLAEIFIENDPLLASTGMVSLYYLLHQMRTNKGRPFPSRSHLREFDEDRRADIDPNDTEVTLGEYELLEFNRLSQSPNDGSALTYRLGVLDAYLRALESGTNPIVALGQWSRENQGKNAK
ncbi:DUF262 domain-containing protein [Rhodoglobus aureus]|uniref:GmrSD restriction endonucleases N-terminal domain-containing protein n=1 Tax=Rhodoglobus aureus TaxID=191497 RepID=A0ABN1VZT0_9MICO